MKKQIISLSFLVISIGIYAQELNNNDTIKIHQIEDIELHKTGNPNKAKSFSTKSNLPTMDNPQAISIVTHELIEQQQAKQLSDLIQNVNGLYVTSSRGNSQASFGGRGFTFGNDNLFKNGARVNSGVFPEVSGLERVEVLKGANAMAFGNVTAGGMINLVTKKPRFHQGGLFAINIGSWDSYKPTIDMYGPLSKNAAFRINGAYETANSFRDIVKNEKFYFNPSFIFNLGKKSQLIIEADYLKNDFTPDFGIGTIEDKAAANGFGISELNQLLPKTAFPGVDWQYQKVQQTNTNITFNYQIAKNWTLNTVASYQNYVRDWFSTERMQWSFDSSIPNDPIKWKRPLNKLYDEQNYTSLLFNLNGEVATGKLKHKILLGTDGDYGITDRYTYDQPKFWGTNGASDGYVYLDNPSSWASGEEPMTSRISRNRNPVQRFGIFVQDLVELSSKWKIMAGLRWSYLENKKGTKSDFVNNTESDILGNVDRAFSPKTGIIFTPNNDFTVFGTYTNSFSPNTGQDVFGNTLNASVIDQLEFGIKKNIWKGALAFNATAYHIISRDTYQTAEFDIQGNVNSDSNIRTYAGKIQSQGFELDITGNPTRQLSLIAGYSYNKTVFLDTPETVGFVENQRLTRTPTHTANASVFYTLGKVVKGLKLGATAYYIGNRIAGWNDTKLTLKQRNGVTRLVEVKDYTTLDFSAAYGFKKFLFQAKIGNALDVENYTIHENYSVNPIAPRNYYLTVSYTL